MSNNDQNEFSLPTGKNDKRTSAEFLPRFFRSEANKKFLQATLDQLIQPGVAEKINGYFGRKTAKAFKGSDVYIGDVNADRENYQLEPALVIKDDLNNVEFYKDYNDFVNQLRFFGANVENHSRLNTQETHAWDPHINWDKFVNFREYYWLPSGPVPVAIKGQGRSVVSTYTVTTATDDDNVSYVFNNNLEKNPTLKLYRGQTYRFEINTPGHPIAFAISRTFTPGSSVIVAGVEGVRAPGLYDSVLYGNEYDIGDYIVLPSSGSVTFNADDNVSTIYPDGIRKLGAAGEEIATVYVENGVIEFTIPLNAPDRLYYISKNNVDTSGLIRVYDIEENTFLDVNTDIIGKKTYTSSNGVEFTNGLKVYFQGDVTPSEYNSGYYYIEGVGESIKLISERNLIISQGYSSLDLVDFDVNGFDRLPFDNASFFPREKDYLTINRASMDGNSWSRYNRWFHKTVIEKSFAYNDLPVSIDEENRAKRPIIEFDANLKLYNYGTFAKKDVHLIDTVTTDVFSTIEGSIGYNIDGVDLAHGMRVLFAADTDILVSGKIYEVNFVKIGNNNQISLIEASDSEPLVDETVLITNGTVNAGKIFYYNGSEWKSTQEKTSVNQAPLFQLCCPYGFEYTDSSVFNSTTFRGTKLFSYKIGSGTADTELGFPLTYKNIENSGDILFEFNLLTDTFTVQGADGVITVYTKNANLRRYTDRETFVWENAWTRDPVKTKQRVWRQYVADVNSYNNFEIDVYDNAGDVNDLSVIVYVNKRLNKELVDYEIDRIDGKAFVRFYNNLNVDDIILVKTNSSTYKNDNGWYEFPINLERNPSNEDITEFTLGEVIDHVNSMIEEIITDFDGTYPGSSNLRDLGNLDNYGSKFVKHSGLMNLAMYHITNKNYNIVKAIDYSKKEYARFKRVFIDTASTLGYDGPVKQHVDKVLQEINKDKIKSQPFYFSDMMGYNAAKRIEHVVYDPNNIYYAISNTFNLTALSSRAVNVYLNGKQLTHNKHYTFNDDGFVLINAGQQANDIIEIYEYSSTDASFVPPTPTKLGLYPKFIPHLTLDDTYILPTTNDLGPFKVYGEDDNGNRGWFYPVFLSKKLAENNDASAQAEKVFFNGSSKVFFIPANSGFKGTSGTDDYEEYPSAIPMIIGHDGSVVKAYKDFRDELLIELENRIFNNIKVSYENQILNIDDYVGGKFRDTGFTKAEIDKTMLKDFVDWLNVVDNDYTVNNFYDRENSFTYNYSSMTSVVDGKLLPGFWRGTYIEAYDTDKPHTHPWEMLGFKIKPSWWNETYGPAPYTSNNLILWKDLEEGIIRQPNKLVVRNEKYARPGLKDFIPVDTQGKLLPPVSSNYAKNFFFRKTTSNFEFGDHSPVETAWRKSSEYPFALIKSWLLNQPAKVMGLGFDTSRMKHNLAGQHVYSVTMDFMKLTDLVLPNTYVDNERNITSGLVNYIYNLVASNILQVYDDYKSDISRINNQLGIKLAGFTDKSKINVILDSRSPAQTSQGIFVPQENYQIFLNTSSPVKETTSYSGVIVEKYADGYVVRGYEYDNPEFKYHQHIETSKDITITVGGISETYAEWSANKQFYKGQIVLHNFVYYRVVNTFTSSDTFNAENMSKLSELPVVGGKRAVIRRNFNNKKITTIPYGYKFRTSQDVVDFLLGYGNYLKSIGFKFEYFNNTTKIVENWDNACRDFLFWTTQGWGEGITIALSPAASSLDFESKYSVVDDIFDPFYGYSLVKADNQPLERKFSSILRNENNFGLMPKKTDNGIYGVKIPLVQKEHVLLLDNETVFNDVIFNPSTGYKQERVKVIGYRSDNWNGGLNIPGFVFDDAKVTEWKEWKDYQIGSLVKYKQFYYVAIYPVSGSDTFNNNYWYRLNKKPEEQLLTNFDYKINQFADFYDLDTDNFDSDQQRMAQHLIGYQKRDYLANIINDDISQYKFYQGFIQDKGTRNAIEKLFNRISTSDKPGVEFYEEWAIQVGRYGATENVDQIEIVIDESKVQSSPQAFELVNSIPSETFDQVYRILPYQLNDAPLDYNSLPFPTTKLKENVFTGGYVHEDDVEYKAANIDELASGDVNLVNLGEYIWVINTPPLDWTVYQHADSLGKVTDAEILSDKNADGTKSLIKLTLDAWSDRILTDGDIVGVKGAEFYNYTGFYKINSILANTITIEVPLDNQMRKFEDQTFILTKLRKVRVDDINNLNTIVQEKIYTGQKVWIDNFEDDSWSVIENSKAFDLKQTITNSTESDSTNQNYATSITASADNRNVFVSAPNDSIGVVHYYKRPNENNNLVEEYKFTPPVGLFDMENSGFGESISVSSDGEFLVIGAPYASNVKTRYKGVFQNNQQYNKNDIVKYNESLWKANRTILPGVTQATYDTFADYNEILNSVSEMQNLLATGAPGLANTTVDHFLVRVPLDKYIGSDIGNDVKLVWNTISFSNLETGSAVYAPWNGTLDIDASILTDTHTIVSKIDKVFYLNIFNLTLSAGDTVVTETGKGIVERFIADGSSAVVYLKDTQGSFEQTGTLYRLNELVNEQISIGAYEDQAYNSTDDFGGYWVFDVAEYDNGTVFFEKGTGLVISDIILGGEDRVNFVYFNVQTDIENNGDIFFNRQRSSFIANLSYYGNPNTGYENVLSNKWVVRATKDYTAYLETFNISEGSVNNPTTYFKLFNSDYREVNLSNTGFNFAMFDGSHRIYDVWDGYIDARLIADEEGRTYAPEVGDIVEDIQRQFNEFGVASTTSIVTNNAAEVVFVQKISNFVRMYVKKISGNWQLGNNIAKVELKRLANETLRGVGDVNRIVAEIVSYENDVVVENEFIGKLVVLTEDTDFEVAGTPEILDEEYYFFNRDTEQAGTVLITNVPSSLNKDYTQVYNIPADMFGTAGSDNEGVVLIYKKDITGYILVNVISSEYNFDDLGNRKSNRQFGKKVKIIKNNLQYTLLVSSVEDINDDEYYGSIEIFRHGPSDSDFYRGRWNTDSSYDINDVVLYSGDFYIAINSVNSSVNITDGNYWKKISWKTSKDTNYRGTWSKYNYYKINSIVDYNGSIYKAKTNISPGSSFNSNEWTSVTTKLDYLGYLPNLTAKALYDEATVNSTGMVQFADDFVVSDNGSVLIVKSNYNDDVKLLVYRLYEEKYLLTQVIENNNVAEGFANSFDINSDGTKFVVSEKDADVTKINQGRVLVYSQFNGEFVLDQVLTSPLNEESENFGFAVSYDKDYLVISSLNGDMKLPTTFDAGNTTFDSHYTNFRNIRYDTGMVYLYEEVRGKLIYADYFKYNYATTQFGEKLHANDNHVYVGIPDQVSGLYKGVVLEYRKPKNENTWKTIRSLIKPVDITKIKSAFLYNKRTNQILTYLDFVDPIQGKIPGIADQLISYKVPYDPAMYNAGTITNRVNQTVFWGKEQVGKLWWNTSAARFVYPYTGDIQYQKENWNTLQPGAYIDVSEWVESDFTPGQWDTISDTQDAALKGVSGKTVYGDNLYTIRYVYDRVAQKFSPKYYFWVRYKKTKAPGAALNALDIARLIAQPRQQGYRFISFLGNNRFVLNNCDSLIYNKDVVLNIQYYNNDNVDQNSHSVYQLITDGYETSVPSKEIERKWFDSLIGYNKQNKKVPDPNLTAKQKYGIQSTPRQGMFVNRFEALKQVIERINYVLNQNIIVDEYDISSLFEKEAIPTEYSKLYDVKVTSEDELRFINTNKITKAELEPIVVDGRIESVRILSSGRGYKVAPSYEISGAGQNAEIKIEINNLGQVISAKVINKGFGYDDETRIIVRRFAVLVEADASLNGRWSVYVWDNTLNDWFRKSIQDYDVTNYWNYVDWYAEGYNEFTKVSYAIDGTYELAGLNNSVGDIVKINSIGSGGWLLLEKTSNIKTEDYTQNYKVVGRENGTINFKSSLYDYNSNPVGFDNRSFDSYFYDNDPTIELRIILETVRDKLFINELKVEYNQLFISSLRYVLVEQHYVDWLFKTSFIKAKHNVGELRQDVTFNNDNLPSYISYVEEVKPYKTVIREFVSSYETLDNTNSATTDFDLPPAYSDFYKKIVPSSTKIKDGVLLGYESNIAEYPRKFWLDNYGYTVTEIRVANSGSGYTYKPTVTLVGGYGEGATAEAYLGAGKITSIKVKTPGKGYIKAPIVVISGPQTEGGTPATASAIIGTGVVRSPKVKIKFDRISGQYFIETLTHTETFTGTNVNTVFNLEWPIDMRNNTIGITVDGREALRSEFTYSNVQNTDAGYTRMQGRIKFTNAPALGAPIVISYSKDISMLNAQDRILHAYNPTDGMFGKDLAQLMDGVDYGGVEVKSFEFGGSKGWDTDEWYTSTWDEYDSSFEDLIFNFDGSTTAIMLDQPLEENTVYNIYLNGIRIDDPNYGLESQTNDNAVMTSLVGNGTTTIIALDDYNIRVTENDIIVIRKITSDGSYAPTDNSYDMALSGGDLAYSTAKGIRAEEIIVDGDSFVTPTTSKGPEELVPGQIMDTLDMQVYTKGDDSTVIGYRMFKDMLNRTHYKRIDSAATVLTKALGIDDLRIEVEDSSNLPSPNKEKNIPGIIFINGERIEYFVKDDNTLRQIRRGTLGTGVKTVHDIGSEVYDQSSDKNIPYRDNIQVQNFNVVDNDSTELSLNFVANSINDFEVFVNGRRLRKQKMDKFNPVYGLDSPTGDIELPPEFEFNINTNTVNILIDMSGSNVVSVIRKTGKIWSPLGESLATSASEISNFLRSGT